MEQNFWYMNILLTCANNRNGNETSTFMDGGSLNRRWGPDLTACLVGLWLHRGRCLTRTGPKYVGSLVSTESLRMYVGYTNIEFICMWVEQNIWNVNILLTCADNRKWRQNLNLHGWGAIESRVGAWLNGLSGGIAIPLAIASGLLLDKDGS